MMCFVDGIHGGAFVCLDLQASASAASASVPSLFGKLRIAFVDDDPANQRVGLRFLKSLGVDPSRIATLDDGMIQLFFL